MKKNIISIIVLVIIILSLSFVFYKNNAIKKENALKFKEEYEKVNGKKMMDDYKYRSITVDKNNPFMYSSLENINKKIENKETFIVYFGAWWCPWCRSILPTAIKEAKANNIDTIYYVNVRESLTDEEQDIRDIYSLDKKKKIYLSHEGTKAYHKFLKYADKVLVDYDSHGVSVKGTKFEGAKRVGAPNYIIVKKGKVTYMTEGVPKSLDDPFMKLDDKILKDIKKEFDKLYEEFKK